GADRAVFRAVPADPALAAESGAVPLLARPQLAGSVLRRLGLKLGRTSCALCLQRWYRGRHDRGGAGYRRPGVHGMAIGMVGQGSGKASGRRRGDVTGAAAAILFASASLIAGDAAAQAPPPASIAR